MRILPREGVGGLQHRDPQPGMGERERGGQPADPGPDDDDACPVH
jgi:hypothetical protein